MGTSFLTYFISCSSSIPSLTLYLIYNPAETCFSLPRQRVISPPSAFLPVRPDANSPPPPPNGHPLSPLPKSIDVPSTLDLFSPLWPARRPALFLLDVPPVNFFPLLTEQVGVDLSGEGIRRSRSPRIIERELKRDEDTARFRKPGVGLRPRFPEDRRQGA